MIDILSDLILRSLIAVSVSLIATYFACHALADRTARSWTVTRASVWLSGAPLVIILWASFVVIFFGLGSVLGEGVLYLLLIAAGLALLVALACLVAAVPFAFSRVTHHWGKAVAVAIIPIGIHLLCGWPQALLWPTMRSVFEPAIKIATRMGKKTERIKESGNIFNEYGLSLPRGFKIVNSKVPEPDTRYDWPEGWVEIAGKGDLEKQRTALSEWIGNSGYRVIQYNSYGVMVDAYVKEPFVVLVSTPGQHGQDEKTIWLYYAREDKGEDFSKWLKGWQESDGNPGEHPDT